jgi:hypothetical protein
MHITFRGLRLRWVIWYSRVFTTYRWIKKFTQFGSLDCAISRFLPQEDIKHLERESERADLVSGRAGLDILQYLLVFIKTLLYGGSTNQ